MKCVLVGDSNADHFECIRKIIEGSFSLTAIRANSFKEILRRIGRPEGAEIKLVLLTEQLPCSDQEKTVLLGAYFERFAGAKLAIDRDYCRIGLVYDNYDNNDPYARLNLNSDTCEISLPFPSYEKAERLFRRGFYTFSTTLRLPNVTLADDVQAGFADEMHLSTTLQHSLGSTQIKQARIALARHFGNDEKWSWINQAIWQTVGSSDRRAFTISDIDPIADAASSSSDEVLAVLALLSSPSIHLLQMEFRSKDDKAVPSSDFVIKLRDWWKNRSISEEDWREWAASIEVRWIPIIEESAVS